MANAGTEFSKAHVRQLIAALKEWPILYDPGHADKSNAEKRKMAYMSILSKMKETMPDLTMYKLKTKIHNLWNNFKRKKPKWCYNELTLLFNNHNSTTDFNSNSNWSTTRANPSIPGEVWQNEHLGNPSIDDADHHKEANIYAECWATTFRKLNAEQRMLAKVEIEMILMRGQLGRLTFPRIAAAKNAMPTNYSHTPARLFPYIR